MLTKFLKKFIILITPKIIFHEDNSFIEAEKINRLLLKDLVECSTSSVSVLYVSMRAVATLVTSPEAKLGDSWLLGLNVMPVKSL